MNRLAVFLLLISCAVAFADPTERDFLTSAATFLTTSPKESIELEKADIWVFMHLMPKELTPPACKSTTSLIDSAIAKKNARGYFARAIISEHCPGISPGPAADMSDAATISPIYSEVVKGILQSAEEGKQKATMADMRAIGTALEAYAVDFNEYPVGTTGDAAFLIRKLQGTYIKKLPLIDAWGNSFRYYCADPSGDYWIVSYGRDGIAEKGIYDTNAIPKSSAQSTIQDLDGDLIFSQGAFVRSPYPVLKNVTSQPPPTPPPAPPAESSSIAKADEYFQYHEFAAAAKLYEDALKTNPEMKAHLTEQLIKCYFNLGVITLRSKADCKLASVYFRQALFINSNDSQSKSALDQTRKCESDGYDSIRTFVALLELRK